MAAGWVLDNTVLVAILDAYLAVLADLASLTYHLYQNNHVPADGDDEADYDECDFDGYAAFELNPSDFGPAAIAGFVAISTSSTIAVYTASDTATTQTVYGYYVTNPDGDFMWAESFATARDMHAGDELRLTPRIKEKTCR